MEKRPFSEAFWLIKTAVVFFVAKGDNGVLAGLAFCFCDKTRARLLRVAGFTCNHAIRKSILAEVIGVWEAVF